jgi:hypothetical protein
VPTPRARGILLLDADMHADQEADLLADGSARIDLWGINLYPDGNRSGGIDDSATRAAVGSSRGWCGDDRTSTPGPGRAHSWAQSGRCDFGP